MTLPPPITSKTNARVKALRAAFSGDATKPGDVLGIEGETMIAEAARSGIAFEAVYVRQGAEAALHRPKLAELMAREFISLSPETFDSAVATESPQGIAATFAIPEMPLDVNKLSGVTLVVEAMQDPGNLGTLVRSAEAFGVGQVLALGNTASAWNPKTVRASAGSVFRVPVTKMAMSEMSAVLKQAGVRVFAAVVKAEGATSLSEVKLVGACALLVGNEAVGLSREALAIADERVHIPCAAESLNAAVAGSVLLYEAMRQCNAARAKQAAR